MDCRQRPGKAVAGAWQAGRIGGCQMYDILGFQILKGHTSVTVGYNLSTLGDARLEKWISVAYVKQGTGTIS